MTKSADRNSLFVPFARCDTEQSIVERFCQQAHKYPAHPAIESLHESLTYSELDVHSNRLANFLLAQSEGKGSQSPVALLFGHNPSMVIAMLGVLKAGKSYLPLDLRWPVPRLKDVLTHSQSCLLLTEDVCEKVAKDVMLYPSTLINSSRIPENVSEARPEVAIAPDQIAYILYTSGSTGSPKGVMQSHRNVLCNIKNYTNDLHLAPSDRLSLLTSFSFAASVSDLYGGLMNGATVCLFDLQHESPQSCIQWLQQKHISIFYSVPSVFRLLGSVIDESVDLSSLRVVKLGGDSVTYADYQLYRDKFPDRCILLVSLGATELNLICRNFLDKHTRLLPGILPVGYPPEDVELILLDEKGNSVHRGEIGQLLVRSPHMAVGYWNDSEKQESRLVFDSRRMNQRLFQTGDLGRFLEDGCLVHLGRSDARVKVHGQAVSLVEIEALLIEAPMVREAVVVARLDSENHTRLVAYIVGINGVHPLAGNLRHFLRQRLPGYMVPADFIFLNALPLNSNGKVDRRQLPKNIQHFSDEDGNYLAPRNALEAQLTMVWERVFEKKPIGIQDNFFNLGGESLMALRLSSEIERVIRMKTTPSLIFRAQTIEALANVIGKEQKEDSESFLVPIQSVGSNPPLFCLLFGSNFKRYLGNYPEQPVYMFFNQGHDGRPALHRSVEEIAARYLRGLRTIQPKGPYYLAGYSFGGVVAFEMAQQLLKEGESLGLLALVDPITLSSKPVPRGWRSSYDQLVTSTRALEPWGWSLLKARSRSILTKIVTAIRWRAKRLKSQSWARLKLGVCGLFFRFGYPLPISLRQFYSGLVVQQAARPYIPRCYPGKMVVFQTQEKVGSYWSKLCAEIIRIHDLPCRHLDIYIDGPHVPILLGRLVHHLEEARRNRE